MLKHQTSQGFTLIELLVVISIIGILSSVVLGALNQARAKSRDAALISGAKEMQKALTLYYDQYNSYPANTPQCTNPCNGAFQYYTSVYGATTESVLRTALSPSFISTLPNPQSFSNPNKSNNTTSRLMYRRLSNNTIPGCSNTLNNCYAIVLYTETSSALGPANTAIYLLSNGTKLTGYVATLY